MVKAQKTLGIMTCCLDDWGGSEELWARSIPLFFENGFNRIIIYKNHFNLQHPEFRKLADPRISFKELDPRLNLREKLFFNVVNTFQKINEKFGSKVYQWNKPAERMYNLLREDRPDILLVSQGINFDGLVYAHQSLKLSIPYLIVSHKAVNFYWPALNDRDYMKTVMQNAIQNLYVSKHNLQLTEEQFGFRFSNAEVIFNPVKPGLLPLQYPKNDKPIKLACIGRLFVIDKGQDILIRILAQPKWKNREIEVTFYGSGPDEKGLKELAELLEVKNINFCGYATNLQDIWKEHHALILPSRSEGLPLTIIEAMSVGRMVIATNAGGNNEIVINGENGYISEANEFDLEVVMDLAWQEKDEWENMGKKAATHILETIPESPEKYFVNLISRNI